MLHGRGIARILLTPRRFSSIPGFRSLLETADRENKKRRHVETGRRRRRRRDGIDEEEIVKSAVSELGTKLERLNGGGTQQELDDPKDSCPGSGIDWRLFDLEARLKQHDRLLHRLTMARDADEFRKWMGRIDLFEEKNFRLPFGGSAAVQEMVNTFRVVAGEQRTDLFRRIDRAFRAVQCQDAHVPEKTTRRGEAVEDVGDAAAAAASYDILHGTTTASRRKKQNQSVTSGSELDGGGEEEFREMKGNDDLLLEKLVDIDRKVAAKLAKLHKATRKRDELPRDERETVQKRKHLPSCHELKGFDVKFVDVHRKCNATKGLESVRYTVCLACGNYHGVVGFARSEDPELRVAIWKSYNDCFQNLYYVERHDERTISKPLHSEYYDKAKMFLWPAPEGRGMKGSRIVETVLQLAGFKDVRSKVIGRMYPENTIMALLRALNATKILGEV